MDYLRDLNSSNRCGHPSKGDDDVSPKDRSPPRKIPTIDTGSRGRSRDGSGAVIRNDAILRLQELLTVPQSRRKADAMQALSDIQKIVPPVDVDISSLDPDELIQTSTMAAETVREIAQKSGNLKGGFVKLLKEVANLIPALILNMRKKSRQGATGVGEPAVLEQLQEKDELLKEKDHRLDDMEKELSELRSRAKADTSSSKLTDRDEEMRRMLIDIQKRVW